MWESSVFWLHNFFRVHINNINYLESAQLRKEMEEELARTVSWLLIYDSNVIITAKLEWWWMYIIHVVGDQQEGDGRTPKDMGAASRRVTASKYGISPIKC